MKHGEQILVVLAAVIVVQQVLKEVFGVNMLGKKIYKGAPLVWKWVMRAAIFRASITQKIDKILEELNYNGGGSTKDMVKLLVENDKHKTAILTNVASQIKVMEHRMDIDDITSSQMLFRCDSVSSCTFVNDAFLRAFGYTWRDMEGFNWESVIHEDDIDEVRERWGRSIATKSRYVGVQNIVCADKEIKTVTVTGYPIIENGCLKGFKGTIDFVK